MSSPPIRSLDGEKAQRIVAAMRAAASEHGVAGSTFDVVAARAEVSRGLLHYYFGTKERLLAEVVRVDCERRIALMAVGLEAADSIDEILAMLMAQLMDFLEGEEPTGALIFELYVAGRGNEEVRQELVALYRRLREEIGAGLLAKEREGAVRLRGDAQGVASMLFAMADGISLQVLSDPEWDSREAFAAGLAAARFLLGAEE